MDVRTYNRALRNLSLKRVTLRCEAVAYIAPIACASALNVSPQVGEPAVSIRLDAEDGYEEAYQLPPREPFQWVSSGQMAIRPSDYELDLDGWPPSVSIRPRYLEQSALVVSSRFRAAPINDTDSGSV